MLVAGNWPCCYAPNAVLRVCSATSAVQRGVVVVLFCVYLCIGPAVPCWFQDTQTPRYLYTALILLHGWACHPIASKSSCWRSLALVGPLCPSRTGSVDLMRSPKKAKSFMLPVLPHNSPMDIVLAPSALLHMYEYPYCNQPFSFPSLPFCVLSKTPSLTDNWLGTSPRRNFPRPVPRTGVEVSL